MLATLFLALFAQAPSGSDHDRNPVFRATIAEGLTVGGATARLPGPTFRDGQSADDQRAALREVAGSTRGADEMLQDSVSAPHRLRLRDSKAEGVTLREGDLYFVLRGVDLGAIRPEEAFRQFRGESVEAGNMKFRARRLGPDDLKGGPVPAASDREWFTRATGRLLDRIAVESTDRVVWSESPDSLVFAARTDPRFPNRWTTIVQKPTGDALGPPQPFIGGIGYLKMTRLKGLDKAAVVEVHFAFAEPLAWFGGDPILRSKFGLIAQDQVRRVRRELQKSRK